jgi:hypothetical protein
MFYAANAPQSFFGMHYRDRLRLQALEGGSFDEAYSCDNNHDEEGGRSGRHLKCSFDDKDFPGSLLARFGDAITFHTVAVDYFYLPLSFVKDKWGSGG